MLKILHYIISPCKGVEEGFTVTCVFCLGARMHGRGTRGAAPASDAARRGTRCPTRLPARRTASGFFFFFFFSDSRRCGSIRAESASIRAESGWFGQNRAVSAISAVSVRIGRRPILPIRPKQAGKRPKQAETGRNRPKSALSMAGKSENLHSSFFFCESRPSMCF